MRRVLASLGSLVVLSVGFVTIARVTSTPVDGISCDMGTQGEYHARAQLTIIVTSHKQYVYPPSGVGVSRLHLCQYWVHTPDGAGTISVDAPHRIVPTLGEFFDIWGQPLAWPQVWHYSAHGGALLAYVNGKQYVGDPRAIKLYNRTVVMLRVGSEANTLPQAPVALTQ